MNQEWSELREKLEDEWAQVSAALSREEDQPYKQQLDRWFSVLLDEDCSSELSESEQTYYHVLLDEWWDRIVDGAGPEAPVLFSPLVETMVYMDFNDIYVVRQLLEDWNTQFKDSSDKRRLIVHWQTLLAQLPVQRTYALYPGRRTVRDQLEQWLGSQLHLLSYLSDESGESPEPLAQSKKLTLQVSVPMMALFIRLLVEREIITGLPQTEVTRFFAAHFSSARQTDISADSLYGSYHKPLPATLAMMRQCLKELDRMAAGI